MTFPDGNHSGFANAERAALDARYGLVVYGNDFDMYFFYCILFIRDGPLTRNAPALACALYVGSLGGWVICIG